MLGIFASVIKTSTGQEAWGHEETPVSRTRPVLEHERRKGLELRRFLKIDRSRCS
jgi:hypothetical protein